MAWEITGNANTDPTANFVGTTDGEPLVLRTNSTERMRLDADGNVGIGTATPRNPLDVNGSVTIQGGLQFGEGPQGISVISSQAVQPPLLYETVGSALVFATCPIRSRLGLPGHPPPPSMPVEQLRIDQVGNVGIGTQGPIAKLDVRGQAAFRGPLAINNADAATVGLGEQATDHRAAITFGATDTAAGLYIGAYTSDTQANTMWGVYSYALQKWLQLWDLQGGVQFAANITAGGDILLSGADCAEQFDVAGEYPGPGTVVVIDSEGAVRESHDEYDKRVAGVVSGAGGYRHAILMDNHGESTARIPVALVGKVYCKVDARYSPIAVGDLLTTSRTPGHAMRAAEPARSFGAVIGKALTSLQRGLGLIPILISLQ